MFKSYDNILVLSVFWNRCWIPDCNDMHRMADEFELHNVQPYMIEHLLYQENQRRLGMKASYEYIFN